MSRVSFLKSAIALLLVLSPSSPVLAYIEEDVGEPLCDSSDVVVFHQKVPDVGTDVVKAVMVGADVAMMTSALLRHGPGHLTTVEAELVAWMDTHDYASISQLRGSATSATSEDPSAFERANYMKTLHAWTAPNELTPRSP